MSALITPQALHQMILDGEPLRLLDATYPVRPGGAVIGDAISFDIDAVADLDHPLPHTLPSADRFAACVGAMGIGNDDTVVIYDQSGIAMAAARAWWMFRVFGHKNVRILDGGLSRWAALGLPLNAPQTAHPQPKTYRAALNKNLVTDRAALLGDLNDPSLTVIDARDSLRFGNGHIPGSGSIPYASLIDPGTGTLIPGHGAVEAVLRDSPERLVASCGSGVTACVVALAFHEAGRPDVAVYDGSWSEWGQPALALPVEAGSGRFFPTT